MAARERLTQLSAEGQVLIRMFQSVNFGQVIRLTIREGEPTFNPAPTLLRDMKLDIDEGERLELVLADFILRDEVRRLFAQFDQLQNGIIDRIDVRSGVPRRVIIEHRLTEAMR